VPARPSGKGRLERRKAHLNNIQTFEENTTRLYYKDQLANAVREILAVCSENHTKHINEKWLNIK
jgi:hypothetical protein